MDLNSDEFCEAYERLREAGMLDPSRLTALPDECFPSLAKLAVADSDLDETEMVDWLLSEKEAAIPQQQMIRAENVKRYILHRFKIIKDAAKEAKDQTIRQAHSEVQAARVAKQGNPEWLSNPAKRNRIDANDRKSADEAERMKWVKMSLALLTEAGWVPPAIKLGEAGEVRMLTRLKQT